MYFAFRLQKLFTLARFKQLHSRADSRFPRQVFSVLILALALPGLSLTAHAYPAVTLAWDANPETDIAGYKVYLGAVSGNLSQVSDVGNATSMALTGLSPATTYYCALQAYDTSGLASALSGEIAFTTNTAAVLFDNWAAGGGLSGSATAPAATPFNDGVPNLLKYAFNLSAAGPDLRVLAQGTGTAGLPAVTLDRNGSQPRLKIEFLRRKDCGLVYTPKISTDLVTYVPMTDPPTVTPINADWERVSIQQSYNAGASRIFARVETTMP